MLTVPEKNDRPMGPAESAVAASHLSFSWSIRAGLLVLLVGTAVFSVDPEFRETVMGTTGGGGQGLTTLVDVDLDGDLDWLMASSRGTFFWEFKGKDTDPKWEMHRVGPDGKCETSAKAFDITGDGYPDQLSGANWLENPGVEGDITGEWKEHTNNGVNVTCADAILGDWNHDGRMDVAYVQKGQPSTWYEIPAENPRGEWKAHVWPDVKIHSGLAAGDLNGDGWLDAVVAKTAFLSQNKEGTEWLKVGLPYKSGNCLVEIGDVDQDGDMDLIQQRHWGSSDNVWVENVDGSGKVWKLHVVGKCETRGHSANIGDIDNDGDTDFELGEDGGESKLYLNEGDGTYRELVFTKHPTHDLRWGDVDRDGDLDMVAKPWGGGDHVYIENLLVDNGGPFMDSLTWLRGPMGSHNPMNPNRPKKEGCMDPRGPNYDFWAFHNGPLNQFCTGMTAIQIKAVAHDNRETWSLSFMNSQWEPGQPTYRVDGSRLIVSGRSTSPIARFLIQKKKVDTPEQ